MKIKKTQSFIVSSTNKVFWWLACYATLLLFPSSALLDADPCTRSICFVHLSSAPELDHRGRRDLHWKLTTHFLPAIPRKYLSVRSHTS